MFYFIVIGWLVALIYWKRENKNEHKNILVQSFLTLFILYLIWLFAYLGSVGIYLYEYFPITLIVSFFVALLLFKFNRMPLIRYVILVPSGIHLVLIQIVSIIFGVSYGY